MAVVVGARVSIRMFFFFIWFGLRRSQHTLQTYLFAVTVALNLAVSVCESCSPTPNVINTYIYVCSVRLQNIAHMQAKRISNWRTLSFNCCWCVAIIFIRQLFQFLLLYQIEPFNRTIQLTFVLRIDSRYTTYFPSFPVAVDGFSLSLSFLICERR